MFIRSLLDEQTNEIYRDFNLCKNQLNNEIDEYNNMSIKMENEFNEWKERLKQNNDTNILLINKAHKSIFKYQQQMYFQHLS